MARKLFEKQGIRTRAGSLATGTVFVVYTDAAGTALADISATSGGSAIAGSTVTVTDLDGLGLATLLFFGPGDGTDTLYLRCPADTSLGVQEIEADEDERLDALEAGGGGSVATHAAAADPHPGYVLESLYDAKGDLLAASAADTPAKLTVGANGTVLTAASGQATGLQWATPVAETLPATLLDAKGDLIVASAADTPARLAVGTAGQVPTADSGQTTGVAWNTLLAADVAANRPAAAAANTGFAYFATDTGVLWRSTGAAWVRVSSDPEALLSGSVAFREPFPRYAVFSNLAADTAGVMHLTAVPLYAGDVITSIAFCSGTTPLTMGSNADGHLWFALYSVGGATMLSQTADQGGAATWAANSAKDLALGAAQTITTTGVYYAGVMVNAGTGGSPAMPSLRGVIASTTGITGVFLTGMKQLSGTNGTGLTATAPAGPLTITNNANIPYCVLH